MIGDAPPDTPPGRLVRLRVPALEALRVPLYRNGFALLVNSGITSLLGLVYWAIVARGRTPEIVGINGALIAAMVAISSVPQYSLGAGLTTFLPRSAGATSKLVGRVYLAGASFSAILAVGYVVVAPRLSHPLRDLRRVPLAIGFVAAVAAWTIFSLQDSVFTGLRRALWVPVENILYSGAKIALVIIFAAGFGGYAIFASWTIPAAVAVIPVSYLLFGKLLPARSRLSSSLPAPPVTFSRFLAADAAGVTVSQLSLAALPLLILARLGAAASARFYIPWMLVQSFDLLAGNLGMSLTVEGAYAGGEVRPILRRLLFRVLLAVAALSLIAAVAAPLLLAVFGARYEGESVTVLRLLLVSSVLKVIVILAVAAFRAELAVAKLLILMAVPSGVVPVAAWLLMPRFGIEGPALAIVIGQAVGIVVALHGLGWLRHRRAA